MSAPEGMILLKIDVNSGSSFVVRDAVLKVLGLTIDDVIIETVSGNIRSISSNVFLEDYERLMQELIHIGGVAVVTTPELDAQREVNSTVGTDEPVAPVENFGFQFAGGDDGVNGFATPNNYVVGHGSGGAHVPVEVLIYVTTEQNVLNDLDNESTVDVTITQVFGEGSGDAAGPTINGEAGPITAQVVNGVITLSMFAATGGYIGLALSNPSDPELVVTDTAVIRIGGIAPS